MGPGPVIVPISDLRQDAAGVLRQVVASADPVFVTQRGRTVAVLLCRLEYDRLQQDHEILSRAVVGDLDISLDEGLSLADILARGRELLDDEMRADAKERAAAARRLDEEAREAPFREKPITLEELLTSCGFGHLVAPRDRNAEV